MRNLMYELTPYEYAVYCAAISEYAASPLLHQTGGKAPGKAGLPRAMSVQRLSKVLASAGWNKSGRVPGAIESLIEAGLLTSSTVEGRSADRLSREELSSDDLESSKEEFESRDAHEQRDVPPDGKEAGDGKPDVIAWTDAQIAMAKGEGQEVAKGDAYGPDLDELQRRYEGKARRDLARLVENITKSEQRDRAPMPAVLRDADEEFYAKLRQESLGRNDHHDNDSRSVPAAAADTADSPSLPIDDDIPF
jgi:hypothetical protein